jgi:Flp pilus assembly protein TadD
LREAYERALQDAAKGNHSAAIERLRDALLKYPSSVPDTLTFLGVELLRTNQLTEAVGCFEQVARSIPRVGFAHSNLGLSLMLTGQSERAECELRMALELDQADTKAKVMLEALLENKRKHNQDAKSSPRP